MNQRTAFAPDDAFLDRVKRAYRIAIENWAGLDHSFWGGIYRRQRPIHEALLDANHDRLRAIFLDPGATDLFYGVDNLFSEFTNLAKEQEGIGQSLVVQATEIFNRLRRELQLGADMIAALDNELGQRVEFPCPFPGEFGLETERGVASYRAIQALYQAWRVLRLVPIGGKAIEIGPGVGRTALFAHRAGIAYSTIDLPIGVVAQACFLSAALGPNAIWMHGDAAELASGRVQLFSASLPLPVERFDLALNVDSMTEMSVDGASRYARWIAERCKAFLSINHDMNEFDVFGICRDAFSIEERVANPYPLRDGYLDDLMIVGSKRPLAIYWASRLRRSLAYRLGVKSCRSSR